MEPKAVLVKWIEAFNQADIKTLASLYHEDAVNHQVANEPVEGKAAIESMFASQFQLAKMHCLVENIFTDGDWAILEWSDPQGLRGCGFFYIIDDKIKLQRGYWDKLSFFRLHNISQA